MLIVSVRRFTVLLGLASVLSSGSFAAGELVLLDGPEAPRIFGATADGTWEMGDGTLGGERETQSSAGRLVVTWDGVDNDPGSLDATGLGGVDLTVGDPLVLTWSRELAAGTTVTLELFSDEERVSRARIEVGADARARIVEIPLGALVGPADPADVGALRVVLDLPGGGEPAVRLEGLAVRRVGTEPLQTRRHRPRGPVTIPARLVLQDGDVPSGGGGNAVTGLAAPFVNDLGEVGFTGFVDDGGSGDGFVFFDDAIVHLNSTGGGGSTLGGAESTMGVSDTGGFILSPAIDGNDGVWTHNGQLAVGSAQAPGFPAGTTSTFHSRPTMLPGGTAYWVSGFDESGGSSTQGRMLYTSPDAMPGTIAVFLRSDDLVGGIAVDRPTGIDFDYDFSPDGAHSILVVLRDTGGSVNDGTLVVDGAVIATEAAPSGDGDNWDNFDSVSINSSGHYLFSGDTDGATGSDEFIAYDGAIVLREGDLVDGATLGTGVQALLINDAGAAVHVWTGDDLFYACDASDLAGTSRLLASTGDLVDLDGDGVGDATLTDFNVSSVVGPMGGLDPAGRVTVEVDLDDGGGDLEAVIALAPPACHPVINEVDYDQTGTDAAEFVEIYNGTGSAVDLDPYSILMIDGSGGGAVVYETIDLPAVVLASGDFYVVCADAANVPNCDLDVTPDTDLIQNGPPDAVALAANGFLVDAISYGGDTGAPYTEDTGTGLLDDPANEFFSVSRVVDGADSDRNAIDFAGRCNSPGEANLSTTSGCMQIPVELQGFSIE